MKIDYKPRNANESSDLIIGNCQLCGKEVLTKVFDRSIYEPGTEEIDFGEGEKKIVCKTCSFILSGLPWKIRQDWQLAHVSEWDWMATTWHWTDGVSREVVQHLDDDWLRDG